MFSLARVLLVSFILISPFLLSGCLPGIGNNSKAPATGEFVKGSTVKGFPSNLPLFKGAQTIESFGSSNAFGASFITDAKVDKVIDFYNKAFLQLGWQSTLVQKSTDNFVFDIKNDIYTGSVIVNVASDGKRSAITMFVAKR